MACRVGMSTEPYGRINYWMNEEGHSQYQILASNLTYDEALAREKQEAEARGCKQTEGGPLVEGPVWTVYLVFGGR